MTRPHADLRPTDFTIVTDSRESRPLVFEIDYEGKRIEIPTVRKKLETGDFSVLGLEDRVCVERKTIDDLALCVTNERTRFVHMLERMRGFEGKYLVVESTWGSIRLGQYHSKVTPQAIIGSLRAWQYRYGFTLEMARDRTESARTIAEILYVAAREHWHRLGAFYDSLKIAGRDDAAS